MPNYKIEGNIDFYSSLYSSLDYDSDNDNEGSEQNKNQICEISGQPLTTNSVILECNHKFNYDAIYTEICKQKFDFQSYTSDVLSKKDLQKVRDSNLDYYIKCPYCRHVQFALLPYYEDLPFQKKYGVNTCDPDFRVIKTSYVPSSTFLPSNYTFYVYGYQFTKGECCKKNLNENGKDVPCYNTYATPIVAPDGSTKLFCPLHIRAEVKAYKLEVKKKAIEDKLKAKADLKQKALADKAEKKALKDQTKSAATKSVAKAEKEPTLCLNCSCVTLLKTGPRKGEACGQKAISIGEKNLCKRHQPK